ncbi:uncharacterized protein LOC126846381 [Adelges cooleyi]|uniref:uncharacterized protein LOC126846381 n=1 Tax=Adelges cooleyi TaxID=133065 RepID=UPI002180453E|nr:uncharacterized protein LOC126846381 [Adelges cooleyi]
MHGVTVLSLLVVLCAVVHAINEDIMQPTNVLLSPEPLLKSHWRRSLGAMSFGINQSPIEPWNEGIQAHVPDSHVDAYRHPLWGFRQPNLKSFQSNFNENPGAFDTGVYATDASHRLTPENNLSKLLAARMASIRETQYKRLLEQQQQQDQQQLTPPQNNVAVQVVGDVNVFHYYPMLTRTPDTLNSTIVYKLNIPMIVVHEPQIKVSEDKANGSVGETKVGEHDTKVSENETTAVIGQESEVGDNVTRVSDDDTTVTENDTTVTENDPTVSENDTTVSENDVEVVTTEQSIENITETELPFLSSTEIFSDSPLMDSPFETYGGNFNAF